MGDRELIDLKQVPFVSRKVPGSSVLPEVAEESLSMNGPDFSFQSDLPCVIFLRICVWFHIGNP
jgi:hypothetical protein